MKEMLLMHHNSDTGGVTIYSAYTDKILFYRTVSGAVLNVMLNFLLIPRYGGIGAATSTLIAQFTAGYFFDAFNINTRKVFFMKTKSLFLILGRS